jgi:hypothetical protein
VAIVAPFLLKLRFPKGEKKAKLCIASGPHDQKERKNPNVNQCIAIAGI